MSILPCGDGVYMTGIMSILPCGVGVYNDCNHVNITLCDGVGVYKAGIMSILPSGDGVYMTGIVSRISYYSIVMVFVSTRLESC